jgi:hypothetical protein
VRATRNQTSAAQPVASLASGTGVVGS